MKNAIVVAVASTLSLAGCATRELPAPVAKDCFYPACSINIEVVDDGSGGKRLKVDGDGNVRMATRHRLVAIVWNLRTPGYEFREDSIRPHTARTSANSQVTSLGAWQAQILPHAYWYDNISVTNQNTEKEVLFYDLTVYPSFGTVGSPATLAPTIFNDPFQGRDYGWLQMR